MIKQGGKTLMRAGRLVSIVFVVLSITAYVAWELQGAQQSLTREAQQREAKVTDDRPDSREIEALINSARAAPAEFAADTIIRVVQSNRIRDREWRLQLLEDAFRLASSAQQVIARDLLPGSLVDTRPGYLANAYRLKLDRVSLQCRVVQAMVSLEKQRARELFAQIPKPPLEPLTCDDQLVYDVSAFYGALKEVIQRTFDHKEREEGEPERFLEQYIAGMKSPVEVAAMAHVIDSLETSPFQLEMLVGAFGNALKKIPADDRSFSASDVLGHSTVQVVGELAQKCKDRGVSNEGLLEALRTYLVNQIGGARCADNVTREKKNDVGLPLYVGVFNRTILPKAFPGTKGISPISENESKPSKTVKGEKPTPYWLSSKAKRLASLMKTLSVGPDGQKMSETDKDGAQWQMHVSEILKEMETWKSSQEKSEADYFHQKCILYYALLRRIPPTNPTYDDVLSRYVTFIRESPIAKESRIEWFLHVSNLLQVARSADDEQRQKIWEALRNSGNPILYLYAELERLVPENKQTGG